MKKKSASRSAFFNLRVLIGMFILLAGVSLALAGLGTFSANASRSAQAQQKHKIINIQGLPPGFDCATIHEKGIDRMEGLKWGLLMLNCGEGRGGTPKGAPTSAFSKLVQKLLPPSLAPVTFGAADVDLVTGTRRPPTRRNRRHSRPPTPIIPTRFASHSTIREAPTLATSRAYRAPRTAATTFTRVTTAAGRSPFDNTFGDPVVLYNKPTGTWFTVWLDGNGGCTLGGFKSTNPLDRPGSDLRAVPRCACSS